MKIGEKKNKQNLAKTIEDRIFLIVTTSLSLKIKETFVETLYGARQFSLDTRRNIKKLQNRLYIASSGTS